MAGYVDTVNLRSQHADHGDTFKKEAGLRGSPSLMVFTMAAVRE